MSVDARAEMDRLLDTLLPFAEQMLQKHGEFFPFGAAIGSDGEVVFVGAAPEDDRPPSLEVIEMLYEGLIRQAAAGEIRGAAVCADVLLDSGDAVRVAIEHADAEPVFCFLPYEKKRLRGVSYGDLFATPGERRVFT